MTTNDGVLNAIGVLGQELAAQTQLIAQQQQALEQHHTEHTAELDAVTAKNEELHQEIAARDTTIAQLHDHITDLERAGAPHGIT